MFLLAIVVDVVINPPAGHGNGRRGAARGRQVAAPPRAERDDAAGAVLPANRQ